MDNKQATPNTPAVAPVVSVSNGAVSAADKDKATLLALQAKIAELEARNRKLQTAGRFLTVERYMKRDGTEAFSLSAGYRMGFGVENWRKLHAICTDERFLPYLAQFEKDHTIPE